MFSRRIDWRGVTAASSFETVCISMHAYVYVLYTYTYTHQGIAPAAFQWAEMYKVKFSCRIDWRGVTAVSSIELLCIYACMDLYI